jgi:hypothetical protein
MINFFRKTRKKMADDNRPLKYMRYAIGEIVLVVVGILIALSINNWNEDRKQNLTEMEVLNDLIIGLDTDKGTLDYTIKRHNWAIESCNIILKSLSEDKNYNDSLAYHFARVHNYTNFYSNKGAYESLKTIGFEIISNKRLRNEIINLYEKWYSIHITHSNILTNDIQYIKRVYSQDNFDKFNVFNTKSLNNNSDDIKNDWYSGEMIPNDFNKLKLDKRFIHRIKTLQLSHEMVNFYSKGRKWQIDELIKNIKLEINRLER